MPTITKSFDELFAQVVKNGASDLHIAVARHPTIRIDGQLMPLTKFDIVTSPEAEAFARMIVPEADWERFLKEKELDLSYMFQDLVRFRVNVFRERGSTAVALRVIPTKVRTFEELNLPGDVFREFSTKQQGFFLVVGPTGHGKSTTLAAMVDYMNHLRADHIITIEDPIEYLFASDKSLIVQREIGVDTFEFHKALRSMFREDVDVAMIGEMRDPETIATAVTAAETGHLVLSTLHTNNAAQTVDRIIDSFPPGQQPQIRAQLAATLIALVSQRLVPRISGGLIPAVEILIATSAVRTVIRENKVHEVDMLIETGLEHGMVSLNRSLADLVKRGEISMETAMLYSLRPEELQVLVR